MTKRTFTGKGGESWEWDETSEVTKAVERLHDTMRKQKFAGNYPGPLYAPHPDLAAARAKLKEEDDKNNYDTYGK